MATPTSRTLAALRMDGWICETVEKYNSFTRQRKDLYGGIDILAFRDFEIVGVQATSDSNVSARVTKLSGLETMRLWVAGGRRLEVWGWAKKGPRGKRKLWTVRRVVMTREHFAKEAA